MQDEYELYKIIVIGSSGTGKTNISTKYVKNQFNQTSNATLGVEFMDKIVKVKGRNIKISLWDTAGQERYKALSKVYYKGASGVLVVYDITDAHSYVDLESWMRLVNQSLNIEDLTMFVVGNKLDLQNQRQVPKERPLRQFQDTYGIDCWEVSAKSGHNIQQMFTDMLNKILDKSSDLKSTIFRGTVQYPESQRGTYIGNQKKQKNRPPSQIIEQEEDDGIYLPSIRNSMPKQMIQIPNRMTLTASEEKKRIEINNQKKKKKCC